MKRGLAFVGLLAWALASGCGTKERAAEPAEGGRAVGTPIAAHVSAGPAGPASPDTLAPSAAEPVSGGGPDGASLSAPLDDVAPPSIAALTPYFGEPPLDAALADFLAGRNESAAARFSSFVAEHPEDPRARPAQLLALLSQHDAGVYTPTAGALEELAGRWPILADYAHYYAGSAHHRAGRFERATAQLALVPSGSTLWPRARELMGRALAASGRHEEALALLDSALSGGRALRASAWALALEERLRAHDEVGAAEARLELAIRFPSLPAGRAAFDALGGEASLTPKARYRLGRALYKAKRHRAVITTLSALSPEDPHYCEARYLMARTHDRMKRRGAAWAEYQELLETCKGQREVRGDATFAAGRNRLKAGDLERAAELLNTHISEFPARSTVDDARLDLARILRDRGEDSRADAMLLETLERYPEGDQRDEVAWRLVWPRIESGQDDEALAMVEEVLAIAPRETHYRAEGRLRYWRAVLLWRAGRLEEASADWRRVLEEHPLSWYALLAYSRLAAEDPEAARATLAEVVAASEAPPDPLTAIPAELWRDRHLRAGVELARMGLAKSARRELRAAPRPRGEDRRAWVWTQVALYQMAGGWHYGQRLARAEEPALGRHWPGPRNRTLWEMAHPRPFSSLVEEWAGVRGIDPHWVWSIMREESNFNPEVESWANAVGLMQIILPTAEFLARGTGIAPTRANLRRPEVAIELGTKYLASLLKAHGSFPLASAGYNAGGGAVKKWRRRFGDVDLDEFVERIPYREARGYAKRVTRSLARYTYLYTGEMMILSLAPPGPPG